MGDHLRQLQTKPHPAPGFDPRATPVPRRRVLLLIGVTTLAGGSLATLLEGCAGPPVPVELDIDPDALIPGTPVEVPFSVDLGGTTTAGSTWLVKRASGEITAFDPRCTHGLCSYRWDPAPARFICNCHDGQFALDGAVLSGKPTRPLMEFPVHVTGVVVEVDVPGNFQTPKESLPE
jgi:nitrite reductase/ring-hydroxylating ferredoxin subunit